MANSARQANRRDRENTNVAAAQAELLATLERVLGSQAA
jgi:hypothetical protein